MTRLVPEQALPAYAFVPGGPFPRPRPEPAEEATLDPRDWRAARTYLYGIDLFNHGYYWEAHEAWEGLWHAAGRRGTTADFLKGLIKLAAAGVKVREGKSQGVRNHARRAAELFERVTSTYESSEGRFMGLDLSELARQAQALAEQPPTVPATHAAPVEVVLNFGLAPRG